MQQYSNMNFCPIFQLKNAKNAGEDSGMDI